MNFINGDVVKEGDKIKIKLIGTEIEFSGEKAEKLKDQVGKKVSVGIRPENIKCSENGKFKAKLDISENMGAEVYIHTSINEQKIVIKETNTNYAYVDGEIKFDFELDKIHVFNKETEITIF